MSSLSLFNDARAVESVDDEPISVDRDQKWQNNDSSDEEPFFDEDHIYLRHSGKEKDTSRMAAVALEDAYDRPPDSLSGDITESYYRLGLEDVARIKCCSKGKGIAKTDADLALELFAEDAESALTTLSDRIMALSLQAALDTDYALLEEMKETERLERDDHNLAVSVSSDGQSCQDSPSPEEYVPPPDVHELPPMASTSQIRESTFNAHSTAFPIKPRVGLPKVMRNESNPQETRECIICCDDIRGRRILVPCGHYYDVNCLVDLIKAAMTDEELFPPRCCKQEVPKNIIRTCLTSDALKTFEEKCIEFSTKFRLYCSNRACNHFLGSKADSPKNVMCDICYTMTCAMCSDPGHPNHVHCKDDDDAEVVLALGRQEGWQRCPGCRQLVELNVGCYHMTCRCRTQFCYLCAAIWKSCDCAQWDENRLVAAAEQRAVRMEGAQIARERQRDFAGFVDRIAQGLRTHHDCDHSHWVFRHGGGQCETCNDYLPSYLMRCTGCQQLACRRCRWNRV